MKNDFKIRPPSSARRNLIAAPRGTIGVFFYRAADLVTFCTPLAANEGLDLRLRGFIHQPHLQLPIPPHKRLYLSNTGLFSGDFTATLS